MLVNKFLPKYDYDQIFNLLVALKSFSFTISEINQKLNKQCVQVMVQCATTVGPHAILNTNQNCTQLQEMAFENYLSATNKLNIWS
jgi:hypothetical protein